MSHPPGDRNRLAAFSLVEVIIAIGIFTFCIVSIIYLLGVALESSRQSQIDSAMTGVLRVMDSELRALSYTNTNAAGINLQNVADGTKYFYFDVSGNALTNSNQSAYRAQVTRVNPLEVAALTAVTNGTNVSPGVTNSTNHYLWVLKVAYPPPKFPQTNSLLLGRSLMGSGSWSVSNTNYNFYE